MSRRNIPSPCRRHTGNQVLVGILALFVLSPLALRVQLFAQTADSENSADKSAPAATENPVSGSTEGDLAVRQEAIALRYKRFEKSLLEMGEAMKKSDPERASLLFRAVGKSKEDRNPQQMAKVMELLKEQRLGDATERQGELVSSLQALLDLLASEDRDKEREQRKKEIEEYLKKLNKIIAGQKDVRAATDRGESAEGLVPRQSKIAERAQELRKEIDKADDSRKQGSEEKDAKPSDESSEGKPGEEKPEDAKSGDKQPGDKQPGESKPDEKRAADKTEEKKKAEGAEPTEGKSGDKKPGEGEPKENSPSEGQPGESQPSEGKPQDGKPSEGQPGESQPQPQQSTPGKEEIEQARREMQRAIDKLKKNGHREASKNQDDALKELEKAKERLEEILRQLREEERDKLLAALEARFQKMLALQNAVYNDTVSLGKIPIGDRVERHTNKSVQLSRQEAEISVEATKTLTLLREEGTAVAFPEAVEQMRDDMQVVVGRLERVEVGELTQSVEQDIIEALKEMIESLQKEMEKKDQKQQQQQPGQSAPPSDPVLVETLAELKMLRSLQLRINGRTQRLGREITGEQATQAEIVNQLRKLSERQARIQKATYDLATGRNK